MRATILWTGGKDSALAFYKARLAGYEVVNLLTFAPKDADFLAHPLPFMQYQAQAIGIPHLQAVVDTPLEDSYEKFIRAFKMEHDVGALVTGDIAEVDRQPNWIRQRCVDIDLKVLMPLWSGDRYQILKELLSCQFKVIISCVKKGILSDEWLGRELDEKAVKDLRKISDRTRLDICGENGEYHTLVLDGPIFNKRLSIGSFSKCETDLLKYIKPRSIKISEKP